MEASPPGGAAATGATVGEVLRALRPGARWRAFPEWPPDAFALVATLLRDSGGYVYAASGAWPPQDSDPLPWQSATSRWAASAKLRARAWRRRAANAEWPGRSVHPLDASVTDAWDSVVAAADLAIPELPRHPKLLRALLDLLAVADEASQSAGNLPSWLAPDDSTSPGSKRTFADHAARTLMLNGFRSLCREVPVERAAVLPKMHTPSVGLTLRSLSHYLSLVPRSPVQATWNWLPNPRARRALNLLLLPWPLSVCPTMFADVPGVAGHLPDGFGYFAMSAASGLADALPRVRRALEAAEAVSDRVDAIVFPEGALEPGTCAALAARLGIVVIGGEARAPGATKLGASQAVIAAGATVGAHAYTSSLIQPKHHRWCLDRGQLEQYGLAGRLPASRRWWEAIEVGERRIRFGMLDPTLAFCVLICEDLARQDPTADVVRSVGPNLVVALLADGPQLRDRWSARYASVLADDPGSSVLTLTSLGMASRCVPPGCRPSRVVGLWRDPVRGAVVLELPEEHDGIVLSLANELSVEHTADGRTDDGRTGCLTYAGSFPVRTRPPGDEPAAGRRPRV